MESVISTDNDDDLNKRCIQKLINGYCRLDDDSIDIHREIVDMCYLYFTCIFSKHVFHCDLFEACSKGDLTVVRQILTIDSNANVIAHGVDKNADESSPCYLGCDAVAEVLLETIKQGINEQNYGTNTLQMAAQAGYNEIVKSLLNATSKRQPKVVKCLMDHNTEGDLCFYGQTKFYSPLMEACHRGFDEIVELLVQSSNININHHKETNYDNATALYLACRGGATQCVRHLLSNHSVIINEATPIGGSPLLIASSQGHDEIVEMLIDHSNRMSAQGINHGILDVNQCNIEGVTPLCTAAHNGHTKIVTMLLGNAADVNAPTKQGRSPLFNASFQGHDEIVEMLIDHSNRMSAQGINRGILDVNQCDIDGYTPLCVAAQNGHTKIVTILLRNEADVNASDQQGHTPLYAAAKNGHTKIVTILLGNAADVNAETKQGSTPLILSSANGHIDVVRVLLSHPSIDIDHQGMEGGTALLRACFTNQLEVVEVLLNPPNQIFATDDEKKQTESRKGANPNLTMNGSLASLQGMSALHIAAAQGNAEIVKTIYEHLLTVKTITSEDIVDFVNSAGARGYTPLHVGCETGSEDVVKYLVNVVKVDIFKKDDDNMNALDIASSLGHNAIVTWLSNLYSDDVDHSLEHESNKANK